jgi:hypothetical protein
MDMIPDKREHSLNLIVLQDLIREQKAEIERLKAALTPSAETKAAYWGEFSFSLCVGEEDGEEIFERITVPWTTVKEIMAAILARAELEGK